MVAPGVTAEVTLAVGASTVTLTVTDEQGARATDQLVLTVEAAPAGEEAAPEEEPTG